MIRCARCGSHRLRRLSTPVDLAARLLIGRRRYHCHRCGTTAWMSRRDHLSADHVVQQQLMPSTPNPTVATQADVVLVAIGPPATGTDRNPATPRRTTLAFDWPARAHGRSHSGRGRQTHTHHTHRGHQVRRRQPLGARRVAVAAVIVLVGLLWVVRGCAGPPEVIDWTVGLGGQ